MFVLPPPPKSYPGTNIPPVNVNPGAPAPLTDTNNTLKHPSGPEYQLVVGEGTYVLRDDFQLATPPPHPSEAPITTNNPLSTIISPPTVGVKLSLVITSNKKAPPDLYLNSSGPNFSTYSIKEYEESRPSSDATLNSNNGHNVPSHPASTTSEARAPAFGSSNALLATPSIGKEAAKRKKPKTNMLKTSSTFVSRVVPHEALSRRLQERDPDCLFVFANINRAVQWLDLTSDSYFKAEHLTKILFTKAHMLCHDVNDLTKTSNHLDVVAGSSASDLIWYEPFSMRYNRINKNGVINPSPVSDVIWIPGSENLFLASHMDGTLIVYDKDREDAAFIPEEGIINGGERNGERVETATLHIHKSVNSKNQKSNPVSSWKISNQRINAMAFSPDCRHLAVVSQDGSLRIIDYLKEILLDLYTSYYGGLTCVCWSPDGKYILTGGQDDLVTIWSLTERRIVARCPGHQSWVSAVAFDPWRCDDKNYRFGSVGEDCRLLLWDFNYNMLHKPKAAISRPRGSIATVAPLTRHRTDSMPAQRLRSNSSLTNNSVDGDEGIEHSIISRLQTAELPPVMSKQVDDDPLSWLSFQEDCIITSCLVGHIRIWDRPKEGVNEVMEQEHPLK